MAIALLFAFNSPVKANPVVTFIVQYLLGKSVDRVWDSATGKPDLVELEKRITTLEAVVEAPFREPLQRLRRNIGPNTTKDDFQREVLSVMARLDRIEQQTGENSEAIRRLETRMASLEGEKRKMAEDLKEHLESRSSEAPSPWPASSPIRQYATPAPAPRYSTAQDSTLRYSTPRYSTPRYSAPRYSAPRYSTPRYSTPRNTARARTVRTYAPSTNNSLGLRLTCQRCRYYFSVIGPPRGQRRAYYCPRCRQVNIAANYPVPRTYISRSRTYQHRYRSYRTYRRYR